MTLTAPCVQQVTLGSLGNRLVCYWLALASLCTTNHTSLGEMGYNITEQ